MIYQFAGMVSLSGVDGESKGRTVPAAYTYEHMTINGALKAKRSQSG